MHLFSPLTSGFSIVHNISTIWGNNRIVISTSHMSEAEARHLPLSLKSCLALGVLPTVSLPLIFDENYPLTRENSPPILRDVRSNILSIYMKKSTILWIFSLLFICSGWAHAQNQLVIVFQDGSFQTVVLDKPAYHIRSINFQGVSSRQQEAP